jgi:hypothetical protein
MQACVNLRMIKGGVLLAARHKREPGQVREDRASAVLAVEPEQGASLWKLVLRQVTCDGYKALS